MSISERSNGYWKHLGTYSLKDGRRVETQISLGTKDRKAALRLANKIDGLWLDEPRIDPGSGKKIWTDGAIEKLLDGFFGSNLVVSDTNTLHAATAIVPNHTMSFHKALDTWLIALGQRGNSGDISDTHLKSQTFRVKALQHHLPDCPLQSVDQSTMDSWRNIILARPNKLKSLEPTQVSVTTVGGWLMTLSLAFEYIATHKKVFGWTPENQNWRQSFAWSDKRANKMRDDIGEASGDEAEKPIATIEELVELFGKSTLNQKVFIGLGIFCGWTQSEITSFKESEMKQVGEDWFIQKVRPKTKVKGRWFIPPELATMIVQFIQLCPPNNEGLAFTDEGGEQITNTRICDLWRQLLKRCKHKMTRHLPFKSLRKTSGCLIQAVAGGNEEMAALQLCHTRHTVTSKAYLDTAKSFNLGTEILKSKLEYLEDHQRTLYAKLKPLLWPTKVKTQAA